MKASKNAPRREDNWKRYPYLFNQCKNLVFECQCGKRYESFPGLYLHFQRKHGQKISTKFNSNECKMIQEQSRIIYKYSLQEKREKKQEQIQAVRMSQAKSQISTVLSQFTGQDDFLTQDSSSGSFPNSSKLRSNRILREFQIYILQKVSDLAHLQPTTQVLYQIPLHFNSFVEAKKLDQSTSEYDNICRVLFSLADWLRKKGYTDLQVVYNDKTTQQQ